MAANSNYDSLALFKAQELLGEIVEIWTAIRSTTNPLDYLGDYVTDAAIGEAATAAYKLARHVLVRSNWRGSGERAPQVPEEFAICLYDDGRVAVRVYGALRRSHDGKYVPHGFDLAYRAVGVESAWARLRLGRQEDEALEWFTSLFQYR